MAELVEGLKLDIEFKKIGINGEGIGYHEKTVVFVDQVLPGEVAEVEITKVFSNRAYGRLKKLITKSPDRIEAFCPIYDKCGGCQLQHITYDKGLEMKRQIILDSFDRYIDFKVPRHLIKSTIGSDDPKHYRNKASLIVEKKKRNEIGLYAPGTNKFVALDHCPIQSKLINVILDDILKLMAKHRVDGFDPKYNKGYIRNLVVRTSKMFDEAQVTFLLHQDAKYLDAMVKELVHVRPEIKSVFKIVKKKSKKNEFFTEKPTKLYGKDTINEQLDGYTFELKPEAFFQLNNMQASVFYQTMRNYANLKPHEIAIDAYAGVAPVSHYIAKDCQTVYAIEQNKGACESARTSLKNNNINNVVVLESDFNRALSGLKEKSIDVMFFDPPRTGLGDETIALINQFKPKRLIYGSCNPSTLAKDLNKLLKDYILVKTQPIDMFSYTSLVESVTLLHLKTV